MAERGVRVEVVSDPAWHAAPTPADAVFFAHRDHYRPGFPYRDHAPELAVVIHDPDEVSTFYDRLSWPRRADARAARAGRVRPRADVQPGDGRRPRPPLRARRLLRTDAPPQRRRRPGRAPAAGASGQRRARRPGPISQHGLRRRPRPAGPCAGSRRRAPVLDARRAGPAQPAPDAERPGAPAPQEHALARPARRRAHRRPPRPRRLPVREGPRPAVGRGLRPPDRRGRRLRVHVGDGGRAAAGDGGGPGRAGGAHDARRADRRVGAPRLERVRVPHAGRVRVGRPDLPRPPRAAPTAPGAVARDRERPGGSTPTRGTPFWSATAAPTLRPLRAA